MPSERGAFRNGTHARRRLGVGRCSAPQSTIAKHEVCGDSVVLQTRRGDHFTVLRGGRFE